MRSAPFPACLRRRVPASAPTVRHAVGLEIATRRSLAGTSSRVYGVLDRGGAGAASTLGPASFRDELDKLIGSPQGQGAGGLVGPCRGRGDGARRSRSYSRRRARGDCNGARSLPGRLLILVPTTRCCAKTPGHCAGACRRFGSSRGPVESGLGNDRWSSRATRRAVARLHHRSLRRRRNRSSPRSQTAAARGGRTTGPTASAWAAADQDNRRGAYRCGDVGIAARTPTAFGSDRGLKHGAPPHGGIGRAGSDGRDVPARSLRDVIAFPKTASGRIRHGARRRWSRTEQDLLRAVSPGLRRF